MKTIIEAIESGAKKGVAEFVSENNKLRARIVELEAKYKQADEGWKAMSAKLVELEQLAKEMANDLHMIIYEPQVAIEIAERAMDRYREVCGGK